MGSSPFGTTDNNAFVLDIHQKICFKTYFYLIIDIYRGNKIKMFKKMINKLKKAIEWYCNKCAVTNIYVPTGIIPYKIVEDENNKVENEK